MARQPNTRQELYDRIRQSSLDEVILEEMVRLGFWPAGDDMPGDPADEIRRKGELERELRTLQTEAARLRDVEALKREARMRRMREARERRKQTKQRRLDERAARAAAWRERKQREIGYLGPGVSGGLPHTDGDDDRLGELGLPVLQTPLDLARAMDISVGELRFLSYARTTSELSHYQRFELPKKTGGTRLISAPRPRLKAAQYWILDNVLAPLCPEDEAHGFRPGRSIVTGARPHIGRQVVVNVDLEDFFPTITYRRVRGLLRWFGYSEASATIMALLTTEPRVEDVELDQRRYHVAVSERFLPQGAPTSPALTNLICKRMDRRLRGAARKLGFTYTRYADDLTFSADDRANVGRLLRQVEWIAIQEGFRVHPKKTRVLGRGRRQEVTGLVVNDRLSVPRSAMRRFRAVLFQVEKDGPAGKQFGASSDVVASLHGFANLVCMVDPERGAPLRERTAALIARHGIRPSPPPTSRVRRGAGVARTTPAPETVVSEAPVDASTDKNDGGKKKKKWWKLF